MADLKRLTTKREHLFPLLGKSDFYADEFTSRLRDTDQEIQSITAKQSEIKAMIEDLAGQQSNLQELRDFIANNREWFQQIKMELDHLSPDDKKRVIECLVNGRIPITTNPEDGSWDLGLLRIRFNSNIFRALADERKISLDSNGSNPSTGP